jgi:hypothetical protein
MKYYLLLTLFLISSCSPSAKEIAMQEQQAIDQARVEEQAKRELAIAEEQAKRELAIAEEQAKRELAIAEERRKYETAIVTCNVMSASRNMDAAFRIKEVNFAREKIGEDLYLGTDEGIKESIQNGLCKELVLNDPEYKIKLQNEINAAMRFQQYLYEEQLRKDKEEKERIEKEEQDKIKREEEERISKGIFRMYYARILWTNKESDAKEMLDKLINNGIPAYIENLTIETKKNKSRGNYLVNAGPFLKRSDFEESKNKIINISGNQNIYVGTDFFNYKVE